jgi:hypothetical protein
MEFEDKRTTDDPGGDNTVLRVEESELDLEKRGSRVRGMLARIIGEPYHGTEENHPFDPKNVNRDNQAEFVKVVLEEHNLMGRIPCPNCNIRGFSKDQDGTGKRRFKCKNCKRKTWSLDDIAHWVDKGDQYLIELGHYTIRSTPYSNKSTKNDKKSVPKKPSIPTLKEGIKNLFQSTKKSHSPEPSDLDLGFSKKTRTDALMEQDDKEVTASEQDPAVQIAIKMAVQEAIKQAQEQNQAMITQIQEQNMVMVKALMEENRQLREELIRVKNNQGKPENPMKKISFAAVASIAGPSNGKLKLQETESIQKEVTASTSKEPLPQHLNGVAALVRDPKTRPIKAINLEKFEKIYVDGFTRGPVGGIRRALKEAHVPGNHLVNIDFISGTVCEIVIKGESVETLLECIKTVPGLVHMKNYRADVPMDPKASEELKARFMQMCRRRLQRTIDRSTSPTVRSYFKGWLESLPAEEVATQQEKQDPKVEETPIKDEDQKTGEAGEVQIIEDLDETTPENKMEEDTVRPAASASHVPGYLPTPTEVSNSQH